jgi:IclR family KDG regulon transcriptional repressor
MAEVLNKAFTLLKLLKPDGACMEWGASELARISGYNVGTTHRILQIMQEHGLVYQNKQNKKFRLGFLLAEYGFLARNLYSIRDFALPVMEELANATRETVYLTILMENRDAVLIDSIDSSHYLRLVEPIGLRLPLYVGAARKVILANMNTERQEELIRQFTWETRTEKTITSEEELRKEIQQIKKQGYAVSFGETTIGTAGVGAPVFGNSGVEASLSVAGPEIRFDNETIPILVEQVTEKAKKLSRILGGHKWL